MIWVRRMLIGLGLAYALVAIGACTLQDSLIYFPDQTSVAEISSDLSAYGHITTSDGERLQVWRALAEPGCPTILFLHGNAGHIARAEPINRAITQETGAGLLAVSWRGYTGSTGKPSEAGLVIDALSAFDHLVAEGVPSQEIIVHGFSLGSHAAITVAAEREVAFLVLEAPFESVLSVAEGQFPFLPVSWLLRDHFRSDLVIGEVAELILIGHGADDTVIAPEHSERLLAHAGQARRHVFEGAGHNDLLIKGFFRSVIVPAIAEYFPGCAPARAETDASAV